MNALDKFCEMEGWPGWLLTFGVIAVVVVLMRMTGSDLPMLILSVPGLYIIAAKQGARGLIKFAIGMAMIVALFAVIFAVGVPCDGWGAGLSLFYRVQC